MLSIATYAKDPQRKKKSILLTQLLTISVDFIIYVPNFLPSSVISYLSTSFSDTFRADLLAINVLQFLASENLSFYLHCWWLFSLDIKFQWTVLFLQHSNNAVMSPLISMVYGEKSAVVQMFSGCFRNFFFAFSF